MTERARRGTLLFALALTLLTCRTPAAAHSLHLFAEGDGALIRGKAYFHGGSPAKDIQVTAFDPEGRKLGQTRTDAQGAFTLPAPFRCDYRLLAATEDGHGAEFRVRAEELSASLPAPGAHVDPAEHAEPDEAVPTDPAPAALPSPSPATGTTVVELAAIRNQLSALRQQLAEYEHRTRLRDLVGGIGYIFGLAGVAFYVAARRARAHG
ncbi:MAG: hypothetical protein RBS80_22330 [Thermoguttaceae bacterium]|nr:hypothetical protein [Thermoguttaceae bacterium]